MASISRRLLLQSRQCPPRIRHRASPRHTTRWQRPISTTPIRCAMKDSEVGATSSQPNSNKSARSSRLSLEEREAAMLSDLKIALSELNPEVVEDAIRKGEHGIPFGKDYELERDQDFEIEEDDKRKASRGFWAEGEESMGPDEDYYGDDLTSHGHGELQQHRELRYYARLIAWELPLLSQLARPFEPPTPATPFRFRYTSYLGESHPASNKVVVEFAPTDLSLAPPQMFKLIKLAGPRYNPSTKIVKMSCEKFDTQAQNKRFLGETVRGLIEESKIGDMFEDVPFDFRHHTPKKRVEFPPEWILTKERKQYLEEKRRMSAQMEDQRLHNGELVDGKTVIDTSLPFMGQGQAEPVMVGGPRGKQLR